MRVQVATHHALDKQLSRHLRKELRKAAVNQRWQWLLFGFSAYG
jgi:hypothetical protein